MEDRGMHEVQAHLAIGERDKRTFFRRHPRWRLTFVLMLALVILWLGGSDTFQNLTKNQIGQLPSQAFTVSGSPMLLIQAYAGHIFVRGRPGDTNKVFVFGYKDASGFGSSLDDIGQQITQHGNTLNMIWTMKPEGKFDRGSESVDLFIDIPANGKATVQTGTGTADINMDEIEGKMTLKTQSGQVSIWGTMQGQSLVQTNSGAIDYCGKLDPLSTSFFQTTTGKITVTLPSNTAFHLQASSKRGKIGNDFHSSDVGITPRAKLQIITEGGAIAIHNGGSKLASCE
jgi:hypothetical protein